jgi:hypothetical protein
MEELISRFSTLSFEEKNIIKIQKVFRGYIFRIKRLPLILYKIQTFLRDNSFDFSNQVSDGRINSCIDGDTIADFLVENFPKNIIKPKDRMWYDILVFDSFYGWLPVNIKTTTTKTYDNTGNLAMCVYSYTDEILDLHRENTYNNGEMSEILFSKLKEKKYNKVPKKDYYFLVLNKKDTKDIIINSLKGLNKLQSNIHNLPFQIRWDKNKEFCYEKLEKRIEEFIVCLKKPKPSWEEIFMKNIRSL